MPSMACPLYFSKETQDLKTDPVGFLFPPLPSPLLLFPSLLSSCLTLSNALQMFTTQETFLFVCLCLFGSLFILGEACIPEQACGGQKKLCRSQISLPTKQVPGINWISRFGSKCCSLPSSPAGLSPRKEVLSTYCIPHQVLGLGVQ